MARAINQVEQELAVLTESTAAIAKDFEAAYHDYLVALGQATRQQMIQAGYHLCTHGYPAQFTQLSLSDRQTLQRNLRKLSAQAQDQLLEQLQPIKPTAEPPRAGLFSADDESLMGIPIVLGRVSHDSKKGSRRDPEEEGNIRSQPPSDLSIQDLEKLREMLRSERSGDAANMPESLISELTQALQESLSDYLNHPEEDDEDEEEDDEDDELEEDEDDGLENSLDDDLDDGLDDDEEEEDLVDSLQQAFLLSQATAESDESSGTAQVREIEAFMTAIAAATENAKPSSSSEPNRPLNPPDISRWQEALERQLVKKLQQISDQMNQLMQTAQVVPGKLPSALLKVAAKADLTSDLTAGAPNIMTLMIEARGPKQRDRKGQNMTQVMAVRLRLAEIELSDLTISVLRSQIRSLLSRLSKLKKDHQRLEKEKAIAAAESAWRSSWFED